MCRPDYSWPHSPFTKANDLVVNTNRTDDARPPLFGDPDEMQLGLVLLIALWAGVIAMWLFVAMRLTVVLGALALPGLGSE